MWSFEAIFASTLRLFFRSVCEQRNSGNVPSSKHFVPTNLCSSSAWPSFLSKVQWQRGTKDFRSKSAKRLFLVVVIWSGQCLFWSCTQSKSAASYTNTGKIPSDLRYCLCTYRLALSACALWTVNSFELRQDTSVYGTVQVGAERVQSEGWELVEL